MFVHERLSTRAILDTLERHKRDRTQTLDLFGEGDKSILEKMSQAYEHTNGWQNRLILGDSLQVMNSLLQYENMGGKVQMVYMDPPYGIKFGSNFQPYVRRRDVKDNDDKHITREPEMVKAYRDTWELGIHSWLTYMRDRLLLAREMLTDSGSCFVQISDENVHYVRNIMDEVFGKENFVSIITFRKKNMPLGSKTLENMCDYLLWYAKNKNNMKYHQLWKETDIDLSIWKFVELSNGTRRTVTSDEAKGKVPLPPNSKIYQTVSQVAPSFSQSNVYEFEFEGIVYRQKQGQCWVTSKEKMRDLVNMKRIQSAGSTLRYILYKHDFPFSKITNPWMDLGGAVGKNYVVQTSTKAIQRCMLMTTDPGDLVFDPTCGSGTTAYVAEQWGRRWITTDVSRVPLSLARQRLLTATYPYYQLKDKNPSQGFEYQRKQNKKGEEVGGIVPHVTLKSIVNNEPPQEEVLVDKPEIDNKIYPRIRSVLCRSHYATATIAIVARQRRHCQRYHARRCSRNRPRLPTPHGRNSTFIPRYSLATK